MSQIVGLSQKIKRVWLDAILDRLAATTDAVELRAFLDPLLADELPGPESRAKTSGIILRIWSNIPPDRLVLRDRAVALLPHISGQERIWLHWGMAALAYSFFRDITAIIGRQLALQDEISTAQVQSRLLMTWGDRATSREAAQKLMNTLMDWAVLRSTQTRGRFQPAPKMTASLPELELWLLEALLKASAADEIEAQQLLRLPEAFPFSLSVGIADLRRHEGFTIHRQGLDMDMAALQPSVSLPKPAPKAKAKKAPVAKPQPVGLFDQEAEKNISHDDPCRVVPAVPTISPPEYPFAAPSAECARQFQAGCYFGCIALINALIEAEIRYIGQARLKRKPNQKGNFEKDLDALHKQNLISDEHKVQLDAMCTEWRSLAYLQPATADDQRKLEEMAHQALQLLKDLEQEFFQGSVLAS